jgi:hypothetical protein
MWIQKHVSTRVHIFHHSRITWQSGKTGDTVASVLLLHYRRTSVGRSSSTTWASIFLKIRPARLSPDKCGSSSRGNNRESLSLSRGVVDAVNQLFSSASTWMRDHYSVNGQKRGDAISWLSSLWVHEREETWPLLRGVFLIVSSNKKEINWIAGKNEMKWTHSTTSYK